MLDAVDASIDGPRVTGEVLAAELAHLVEGEGPRVGLGHPVEDDDAGSRPECPTRMERNFSSCSAFSAKTTFAPESPR